MSSESKLTFFMLLSFELTYRIDSIEYFKFHCISCKSLKFNSVNYVMVTGICPENVNQDKSDFLNLAGDWPVNLAKAEYMADLDLNPDSLPIASIVK